MKRKNKILIILLIFSIVGAILFLNIESNKTDCSKPFNVVYLKPSEMQYASEIVNKKNRVVVFPELNQVNARTEILECPSFDINNYLNLGENNGII